jgi:tetratricopeptide (TPR) repeat protein
MPVDAMQGFDRAATLDPAFAAAHLRAALAKRIFLEPKDSRVNFQRATALRESLDPRDRALLDAAEPTIMREPSDHAESTMRYLAALERFPDDFELLWWLTQGYSELGDFENGIRMLDRMETIDPGAPLLWSVRALARLYVGDRSGAREAAIECRRVGPGPSVCAHELTRVLDDTGACGELETAIRGSVIASPDDALALHRLGRLLLAQERPAEAALDYLARSRALWPEEERPRAVAQDEMMLAYYRGDFAALEQVIEAHPWEPGLDALLVRSGTETGRPEVVRAAAERFFATATRCRRLPARATARCSSTIPAS